MRALALSVFLSIFMAMSVFAQDVRAADPAIEGTITSQIEAFRADDFATAFTYASPNIKGIFGTPDNFGNMVRQGYPMVWRPGELRFLELRDIDGMLWQKLMIQDQNGALHILDYQMIPGENGWQINAVQLLRAPGVGA